MHASYIVRARVYARVSIYYTYNSLTEIRENARPLKRARLREGQETKERARGWRGVGRTARRI